MWKRPEREILKEKNEKSIKMKCKYCGSTNTIPYFVEERICRGCHRKIKNTTQAHFTKTMLEKIKEMNNNE